MIKIHGIIYITKKKEMRMKRNEQLKKKNVKVHMECNGMDINSKEYEKACKKSGEGFFCMDTSLHALMTFKAVV